MKKVVEKFGFSVGFFFTDSFNKVRMLCHEIFTTPATFSDFGGVNDEARLIFVWFNYGVVCQVIALFGVVSNIINIVCFVRQGCQDPVNISLLGKN